MKPLHSYIRCDGLLCKTKSGYIRGDRYKCAVCPDTDFCANCEAFPNNTHCRSHPLIKLRVPVRNVSVTTFGEDGNGEIMSTMGDKQPSQTVSKSTETAPAAKSTNAATQVQIIADIKPGKAMAASYEPLAGITVTRDQATGEIHVTGVPRFKKNDLKATTAVDLSKKDQQATKVADLKKKDLPTAKVVELKEKDFQAWFVSDTLVDNTQVQPGQLYTQTWTLKNPGPSAWPIGCAVRYTGGDNMLNISIKHAASTKDIEAAVSSNSTSHEVMEGEEIRFSVTIKAPMAPGRAVSYWRLKTAGGEPFGHKLWCDVLVADQVVKEAEVKTEETKTIEEVPKEAEAKLETSQMVFPTLEKESPTSSIIATSEPKTSPAVVDDVEFVDDLEELAISDVGDESEDAFLTDEDFEMLDSESVFEEAVNGKK